MWGVRVRVSVSVSVGVSVILGVGAFCLGVCIEVVGKGAKINLSVEKCQSPKTIFLQ